MRITQGKSIAISEGLVYFGCIVQMIFCAYLVIQGEITMGILLGALQIANYVINPARQITSQLLEYKTVKPVIARVVAVLDGEGAGRGNGEGIHCQSRADSSGRPALLL